MDRPPQAAPVSPGYRPPAAGPWPPAHDPPGAAAPAERDWSGGRPWTAHRLSSRDIAHPVIAHHDGAVRRNTALPKQRPEKPGIRLFYAVVRGEVHAVEQAVQPQLLQLLPGKNALRVGQHPHPAAQLPQSAKQLRRPRIEAQILRGPPAERQPRADSQPDVRLHAFLLIEPLKDLLDPDLRMGLMGVPVRGCRAVLQLAHQPQVSVPQLPRLITGPLPAEDLRHVFPQPGRRLIRVDVHQGAVQVKNTVPVTHQIFSPSFRILISR